MIKSPVGKIITISPTAIKSKKPIPVAESRFASIPERSHLNWLEVTLIHIEPLKQAIVRLI
ncbi:MAG: hypothetical protein GY806_12350 [Gammaproteobacteria bacterium]|nr:hypothetical protein [Gammaproteobacteria bacterium]